MKINHKIFSCSVRKPRKLGRVVIFLAVFPCVGEICWMFPNLAFEFELSDKFGNRIPLNLKISTNNQLSG